MDSTLAKKLGVKPSSRTLLIRAPADVEDALRAAEADIKQRLSGSFASIHAFVKQANELERSFPRLKPHLEPTGALWIAWPKKGALATDLTLPKVIKIGYDHGLVESKCVSVNATWSGLKFTFPKPGKTYNNSFGVLKR